MPYDLLANLVSVKTGKPFLENMERFGFIPDAVSSWNPHGLPIGLSAGRSRNGSHIGLEEVGFNCAGCHVSELTYHGKKLLIDGAPSHVDLQAYQVEFKESLEATMHDPVKLVALVVAINRTVYSQARLRQTREAPAYSSDPAAKTASKVGPAPTGDKSFHSKPSRQADVADPAAGLRAESPLGRFRSTAWP